MKNNDKNLEGKEVKRVDKVLQMNFRTGVGRNMRIALEDPGGHEPQKTLRQL